MMSPAWETKRLIKFLYLLCKVGVVCIIMIRPGSWNIVAAIVTLRSLRKHCLLCLHIFHSNIVVEHNFYYLLQWFTVRLPQ
uniref:Putative secreted protein n=1 Tax=Ixodes ricinus TaxID=34613 RepID=A0A147BPX2_IXORI